LDVSAIYDRGQETINSVYGAALLSKVFNSYGSHKEDFKFTEIYTLYGLYLSDFEVLTPLETEAVVYSSISCLGLGGPGNWHLRGMGRLLGARGNDGESEEMKKIFDQLQNLKQAVVSVVEFVGGNFLIKAKLGKWASPEGVTRDMGGWGDDL
jgi:Ca2+-binding EF-hand superfamily protein